ncbi:hypothetical protein [Micromonospora sp. DT31]|uniref:hypothetical protein n=1 Tax=Micromonospora sp. DT31 TaxID=3393434 RepID=UPI003CEFBFB4
MIAGAGVPAVRLLTAIGDEYANWILTASADGDLGKRLLLLAPSAGAATATGLSALAVTGISLMVFLSTMVQLLLLARNAGLVLLAGLLPVAAAVGGSVRNRQAIMLAPAQNEQGWAIRTAGRDRRVPPGKRRGPRDSGRAGVRGPRRALSW